jgi:hypothetical protein
MTTLATAVLAMAIGAAGPGGTVAGRVVRVAAPGDTVAAAGAMVVMHGVTPTKQGPLDSIRVGRDGRFRFAQPADSTVILLISSQWDGVQYFSTPIGSNHRRADSLVVLVVADSASTAPVTLAARHLVISAPAADGTRSAVDLLILANDGYQTRVPATLTAASWRFMMPRSAVNLVLGESDFAEEAVQFHGDTLELHAALPPGQRQLLVHYQIPPATRALSVPWAEGAPVVNVLLEERDATAGAPLARADTTTVDGRHYTRWTGAIVAPGDITLRFGGDGQLPGWVLKVLAALFGMGLLGMALLAARRANRPVPVVSAPASPIDELLDAIAQLDARHAGGEGAHGADAWQQYQAERARLKEAVRSLLPR